jgi:UDPglucose 6-dehydrogenase
MRVGFCGLGKLGLPVTVAISQKLHEVYGYDIDPKKRNSYRKGKADLYEPDLDKQLALVLGSALHIVDSVHEIIKGADLVFVAVPTPSKKDNSFDLSSVIEAVESIGKEIRRTSHPPVVAIISTMLPTSTRKYVAPALEKSSGFKVGKEIGLCYSPQFIAMGTTIDDYLHPEFCLIGESDARAGATIEEFYKTIVAPEVPKLRMTWENAELIKEAYNTMISFKIVYANTLMEMCHKVPGADVDVVSDAISQARIRIVGPAYLRGGMGDSGACHPRDNLALSRFAQKLSLSADPFKFVMNARERQAKWLASQLISYRKPIVIMAVRYKRNTNLIDYSSSLQLAEIIKKEGHNVFLYDPLIPKYSKPPPRKPSVFLIAQDAPFVHEFAYPPGSVVLDVWRCFKRQEIHTLSTETKPPVAYVPVGRYPEK